MDVHVGEVNSTVRAADSRGMLSPQVMEQIVQAVLQRLQEEQQRAARIAEERQLSTGVTGEEAF